MEALRIAKTDDTPEVVLDAGANEFVFSGKSLPEDVLTFYNPILDWFDTYGVEPNPKTIIQFKLVYFNTASSKLILDILFKIQDIYEEGHDVAVEWHYHEEDEDMEEAGEEYSDLVEVPFELKSYDD